METVESSEIARDRRVGWIGRTQTILGQQNYSIWYYSDGSNESEEELTSLLMKVKEDSETAGVKLNIQKTKIMASSPITSWQIEGGKVERVADFIFLGSKITADGDCNHKIKRCLVLERKAMTNLDSVLKNRHHFADKGPYSQSIGFSSSHVQMWELNHKEGWVPKNWRFWTMLLEKTLESPLDSKEIKPVNPKGHQFWIFIGRTDVECETQTPESNIKGFGDRGAVGLG